MASASFWHFLAIIFTLRNHLIWLRMTDDPGIWLPEMRIWSILLIWSNLKWCIHLSISLFLYLYTSLPHDLIKEKVLSLVKWCFNRESKTYLCTSDKAGFITKKKYDSYKCWTCTEFSEAFTFLMENIYGQFDYMVFQQIVEIPMGTNYSTYSRLIFIYFREGFYVKPPEIQTVWPHSLVQRYLSISWRYIQHSNSLCSFRQLAKTDTPPNIKPRYTCSEPKHPSSIHATCHD